MAIKDKEVQAKARRAKPTRAMQEPEVRAQEQRVEEVGRERTMRERVTATIVAKKVTGQGTVRILLPNSKNSSTLQWKETKNKKTRRVDINSSM